MPWFSIYECYYHDAKCTNNGNGYLCSSIATFIIILWARASRFSWPVTSVCHNHE